MDVGKTGSKLEMKIPEPTEEKEQEKSDVDVKKTEMDVEKETGL